MEWQLDRGTEEVIEGYKLKKKEKKEDIYIRHLLVLHLTCKSTFFFNHLYIQYFYYRKWR